jgi:DNA modification methylase
VLKTLPENSVSACVTDPPYGMAFMNKGWDFQVPGTEYWTEVGRVMQPGAFLFAFCAARTYHHLAFAVAGAGFEIRDMFHWTYRTGMLFGLKLPDGSHTLVRRAHEPILVARKPLEDNAYITFKKWGTGGLNIEACRIDGRLPSNVIEVDALPATYIDELERHDLYCPKPSKREKEIGLDKFPLSQPSHDGRKNNINNPFQRHGTLSRNPHSTVKPLALMDYLCLLANPSGGTILDPFLGSGTTGMAAVRAGFAFVGIEKDPSYREIAAARIQAAPLIKPNQK